MHSLGVYNYLPHMQQSCFWQTLNKPVVGLAPMDGVSDFAFRHIQKKYGQPDVMFTEFVSAEGLCHGAVVLLDHLIYNELQQPIVAQLFGKTPQSFRLASVLVCQLGFDGIDINMGCPAKNVANHGAGAGLISTPQLAQEIVKAVKLGIMDYQNGAGVEDFETFSPTLTKEIILRNKHLPSNYHNRTRSVPVSVKTRLGYSSSIINQWLTNLLEVEPDAITIHGRTLKQGYSGQADWEEIAQAAEFVRHQQKNHSKKTLIFGNGDVQSRDQAELLAKQYDLDGVLIGRASFGNPFVFQKHTTVTQPKLTQVALEHAQVFESTFAHRSNYSFLPMRKHLGWYIKALPNAKEIRQELFKCWSAQQVENTLVKFGLV